MTSLNIKYPTIIIAAILFLSSCATILNGPIQKVSISTDKNIKAISIDKVALVDSSLIGTNVPKTFYVLRSGNPLKINLEIDSVKKVIYLKPKKSFAYWFNIYANYGIGMLIDKGNVKKYAYPSRNYLTAKDSSIKIYRFAPIKKGTLNLSLSLPFITIFNINTKNKYYQSGGVFGLEAGVDYFYKDNKYLSFNVGTGTDIFGEHFGKGFFETGSTIFTSVRNNNIIGSFDVGYGIHVSQLKWARLPSGDTIINDVPIKNIGLGFSLSAQYRFGHYFKMGILYQPNLWNTSFKPTFDYQHYISVNLIWKIPMRKPID
jgi:hypothetical protein